MTVIVPDIYEGREQALVKHALLESYLEKLVLVIGMAAKTRGHAEICFVDCFAGPWGSPDEKLAGTSIALSLRTLEACKAKLASLNVDVRMRALYIEKSAASFKRLSAFLNSGVHPTIAHECRHGDFVDLRAEILSWCGPDAFTFFFIDPKGWKDVGVETLTPLLKRPRSEFLVNFAYNFVNRTASMKEWQEAMIRLLGKSVALSGLSSSEREDALVNAYREGLKARVPVTSRGYRARTAYVSVLDPLQKRTKYHLVYLTSHPIGITEFMDISEKVDLVQAQVRTVTQFDARAKSSGVVDMFTEQSVEEASDARSSPDEVDQYWLHYLANGARQIGVPEFADILESTNWLPGELQASLMRLVKAGKVQNLDANASRRRTRPLHFEKAEHICVI
jgi:three-Cys-motif partner protein